MSKVTWIFVSMAIVSGCGETEEPRRTYPYRPITPTSEQCGNDTREGSEICDGTDLDAKSCETFGYQNGELACQADCRGFDTFGCDQACDEDCSGRVCGPDPVCGISCGTCAEGTCTPDGQCHVEVEGAPQILMFNTNITTMTSSEILTFSAVVTDPDGIGDLIGGVLEDQESGGTYGSFAAAGGEGAFSLSLSWSSINTVRAIDSGMGGASRTFWARFFDTAGNEVWENVTLSLRCSSNADLALCDGGCTDLATDANHCEACYHPCQPGPRPTCRSSTCYPCQEGYSHCGDACVDTLTDYDNCGACDVPVPDSFHFCEEGAPACYSGNATCDDGCANLDSDQQNCGSCGYACAVGYTCDDRSCQMHINSDSYTATCDEVCEAEGLECVQAKRWYYFDWDNCTCSGLCEHVDIILCDDRPGYMTGFCDNGFRYAECICQ